MQLVVQYGAPFFGGVHDIVVAHYPDGVPIPLEGYPSDAVVVQFDGDVSSLGRAGPEPRQGGPDARVLVAPPLDLLAYAKQVRWRVEIGGILVGGTTIATDDRAKTLILGAWQSAKEDPSFTTDYDGPDGDAVTLNATQVIAVGDAIRNHVNACFRTFSTVRKAIASGTITSMAQVDAAFATLTA